MTKQEHINYWIESAENDLIASQSIFDSKIYHWSLFIAHLALEKIFKAIYIQETTNLIPPKTHNLLKLAELSKINLTQDQKELLAVVNKFHLQGRYFDFKEDLRKTADEEFTKYYLKEIKDIYLWLKSQII